MIRYQLKNFVDVRANFKGKLDTLEDPTPVFKIWGEEVLKWIILNYRSSGGKVRGWKALRPLTLRAKPKMSGIPLEGLTRGWSYDVKPWGVRIGHQRANILMFHEKGTRPYDIKPVNRKFLWFGVNRTERWTGQQIGGHAVHYVASKAWAGRAMRWAKKGSPGIFRKKVHHPGLPIRRQLPNRDEVLSIVNDVSLRLFGAR